MRKYIEFAGVVIVTLALAYFLIPGKPQTYGSATGYDSLKLTPSASTGDSYGISINGVTTEDMNGNIVGAISQSSPATVNVIPGTLLVGSFVQGIGGFQPYTTTSTVTIAQFCAGNNIQIANTTGTITLTLPAAATITSAPPTGCGALNGGWANQIITNDSTNSVMFAGGAGDTFRYQTLGVGTSTLGVASSTGVPALSSVDFTGYPDTSSTFYFLIGPEYK